MYNYPPNVPPRYPPRPLVRQRFAAWFGRQTRSGKIMVIVGSFIGFIMLCSVCGGVSNAFTSAMNGVATPTTQAATQNSSSSTLAATATDTPPTTNLSLVPTDTPTTVPTAKPTPKPTPIPTPKPVPTHAPQPTQPACQAINGNPWCYNFSPGSLIYTPPSGFCNYFNCIATFYASDDPGDGFIIQCVDGTYSQSGGERGACSSHGGESRPLYAH